MPVNTAQVEAFARRLRAAAGNIDLLEDQWQDTWGPEIAGEMSDRAPRDTGALAASIRYDGSGTVTVGVTYGGFVEYGTSRQAPQPYMKPSVDRLRPEAVRDAARKAIALI